VLLAAVKLDFWKPLIGVYWKVIDWVPAQWWALLYHKDSLVAFFTPGFACHGRWRG